MSASPRRLSKAFRVGVGNVFIRAGQSQLALTAIFCRPERQRSQMKRNESQQTINSEGTFGRSTFERPSRRCNSGIMATVASGGQRLPGAGGRLSNLALPPARRGAVQCAPSRPCHARHPTKVFAASRCARRWLRRSRASRGRSKICSGATATGMARGRTCGSRRRSARRWPRCPGPQRVLLDRLGANDGAPDTADVFMPIAAAHGWVGRLRAERDVGAAWAALAMLAGDERAPVRLGTLDALTSFAARAGGGKALLAQAVDWLEIDDREVRFGAAGVVVEVFADRQALAALANPETLLDYLSRAIAAVAGAPRAAERSDARRRLLLALPRTLATVAAGVRAGDRGAGWLEEECRTPATPMCGGRFRGPSCSSQTKRPARAPRWPRACAPCSRGAPSRRAIHPASVPARPAVERRARCADGFSGTSASAHRRDFPVGDKLVFRVGRNVWRRSPGRGRQAETASLEPLARALLRAVPAQVEIQISTTGADVISERTRSAALVFAFSCAGFCAPGCTGDDTAAQADNEQTRWEALMSYGDPNRIAPGFDGAAGIAAAGADVADGPFLSGNDCSGSPLALWTSTTAARRRRRSWRTPVTSPIAHPAFRAVSVACVPGIDGAGRQARGRRGHRLLARSNRTTCSTRG